MPNTKTLPDYDLADVIMINGMPFNNAAVMEMENGEEIWAQGVATRNALHARSAIRNEIKLKVGDPESLLGTTADGAQLAIAVALVDIAALADADSFEAYKAQKMAMLGALIGKDRKTKKAIDVGSLAKAVLGKIQSGDVLLTAVLKGVPSVLDEVMTRATKVVGIIARAQAK